MRPTCSAPLLLLCVAACATDGSGPSGPTAARLGFGVPVPATVMAGVPIAPTVVVQVQDATGAAVGARGINVSVSVSGGSGALSGTTQVRTDADGRAAFTSLAIAGPTGTYTLRFTAQGLSPLNSPPVSLEPGPPATALIAAGNNQTAPAGTTVPVSPAVLVRDASANPIAGVAVTYTVTSGGGAVTGGVTTTGSDGIARVAQWTLGPVVGANTLGADIPAVTAPALVFSATGVVGPAATLTILEGDAQQAVIGNAVATAPTVRVTDAFDNPVSGLAVTFTPATGGGTVTGGTAIADANGIARVGSWRLGLAPGMSELAASRAGVAPVVFSATAVDHAVTDIGAGTLHSCALGSTTCWGDNSAGQLGRGNNASDSLAANVLGGVTFTEITVGNGHACGLTSQGAAWCWGANGSGQLGDGTTQSRTSPVAVVGGHTFTQLSAGGIHTCGRRTDGAVLCWGEGANGRLGYGLTLDSGAPVPTSGGHVFSSVSAGAAHTCAVRQDGMLLCWGSNGSGRLGDGSLADRLVPTDVAGAGIWSAVAAGGSHTCALDAGAAAFCWGLGTSGQLGTGAANSVTTPAAVAGGSTFAFLTAGAIHTCAVDAAGAAWCWGSNGSGRLGDGTTGSRLQPTAVSGGLTWTRLSAGSEHTCGRSSAGSALCWGRNQSGQLGDNSTSTRLTPVGVWPP